MPHPLGTTAGPQPLETTAVSQPLGTTAIPQSMGTMVVPKSLDTTAVPHPLVTTVVPKLTVKEAELTSAHQQLQQKVYNILCILALHISSLHTEPSTESE